MVHTIHLVGTYCGMLELGESVILSELQLSEPGRRPYKLARNMSKQGAHWISGSIPILFINLHHRDHGQHENVVESAAAGAGEGVARRRHRRRRHLHRHHRHHRHHPQWLCVRRPDQNQE